MAVDMDTLINSIMDNDLVDPECIIVPLDESSI